MDLYAHSLTAADTTNWEPLSEHLHRVARRAATFAEPFGLAPLALAAGLLHDVGKCSDDYQRYIRGERPKGPDHSTAGARVALSEYGRSIGRILAFGIAGHHSGLMDGSGFAGRGRSLTARLDAAYPLPAYDRWRRCVSNLPPLDHLKGCRPPHPTPDHPGFETAFLIRMLFSCLVDADFLETEQFYTEAGRLPAAPRGGILVEAHLERLRAYMAGHRRDDSAVNRLRAEILDHACAKALLPPGLFTLTVPTGGGKTLTSLSFALEHAFHHGLRRIVYVIPFTSIIEQTAKVFRDRVGLGDAVLEHHSAFEGDVDTNETEREDDAALEGADGRAKLRRDAENWDAPIIVTTAVQFFESLFASRTSRARKLHNLARSVIVLDEVQTLPVQLLRPCMAALDQLARNYGASIVLCTATQPALRQQDKALPTRPNRPSAAAGFDIDDERELAPHPKDLYEAFKRVDVEWRREPVPDAEIAERFAKQEQMLCIVNTRAHARDLFGEIAHLNGARHLTTLMYPRHRREVLADIRAALSRGAPVRLVATSLIEAGVDVDFPEVWRAATGLDSVAQAAGRCNREGRLIGRGRTVVFEPEARKSPPALTAFRQAAESALRSGDDPLGLESIHRYFHELYFVKGYEALDAAMLDGERYSILADIEETRRQMDFPFSRIAQAFRLIDEIMASVLIPRDADARSALDAVRYASVPPRAAVRLLQQYAVPVPRGPRSTLLASGAVQAIRPEVYGDRFLYLESLSLYDDQQGLMLGDPTWRSSEENVW